MGATQVLFRVNVDGVISHGLTEPVDSIGGVAIGPIPSIGKNLISMFPRPGLYVALTAALLCIPSFLTMKNKRDSWHVVGALAVCALLPYVWFAIVANHSMIHYYFTFRLQIASVFSVLSFYVFRFSGTKPRHSSGESKQSA